MEAIGKGHEVLETAGFDNVALQYELRDTGATQPFCSIGDLRKALEAHGEVHPMMQRYSRGDNENFLRGVITLCKIAEELFRSNPKELCRTANGEMRVNYSTMLCELIERSIEPRDIGTIGTVFLDNNGKAVRIVFPEFPYVTATAQDYSTMSAPGCGGWLASAPDVGDIGALVAAGRSIRAGIFGAPEPALQDNAESSFTPEFRAEVDRALEQARIEKLKAD